jgi:hypothetical protein
MRPVAPQRRPVYSWERALKLCDGNTEAPEALDGRPNAGATQFGN